MIAAGSGRRFAFYVVPYFAKARGQYSPAISFENGKDLEPPG